MKKAIFFSLAFACAIVSKSQILFVPSGPNNTSGISTSTTAGVGIGLINPQGRFDIKSTATLGGLKILTTTENVIGGTATTPYAFKVQYQQSVNPPSTDETVAQLSATGVLNLGAFNSIPSISSSYLNVRNCAGIYADNNTYIKLQSSPTGHAVNWTSTASNNSHKNLNFSFNSGSPMFSLTSTGKVGIGTPNPTTALQIVDNTAGTNTGEESYVNGIQITNNGLRSEDYAIRVTTYWGDMLRLSNSGSLYLGPSLNGKWFGEYRLYVENGIRTEKIRVDVAADNGWADFVFDEGYELMSTQDLAAFIAKNKHLPNVPSAAQVAKEGIDLAEMNAILLRQIEELTLRVIELESKKAE